MKQLSFIIPACSAKCIGEFKDHTIQKIVTDSRVIHNGEGLIFAAMITNRNDGHHFIADAYSKGVRCFLVSKDVDLNAFSDAIFLLVDDTVVALQSLAAAVREQYSIPVIGVTGSNGKTITKEWLNHLLTGYFNIVRSPKSYNSQIGVPLSVWQMNEHHTLGIFEAGISQKGEMHLLEKIIKPTIGIFTNIGEAHNQGFENISEKIKEKLILFKHSELLIYCQDYDELHDNVLLFTKETATHRKTPLKAFSWSYKYKDAQLHIKSVHKMYGRTNIRAKYENKELEIEMPFSDAASIENAINCWCVMLHLQVEEQKVMEGMASLKPLAMRLEMLQGENNCIVINDSYNSDLKSLNIALDMLDQQKQQKSRTVFLSDIQQSGRDEHILYEEVAAILKERNVQRFFGIGQSILKFKSLFENNKNIENHFCSSTEQFLQQMHLFAFEDEAILLKGARSFAFEKIKLLLDQKVHQTVMTISLSALQNNLDAFRRRLKSKVKTMAMVKASSYGSGGYEVANVLQEAQVDYLTVAYADEGISLRKANIQLPIMVMSPATESFDRMIMWKLEPEIFNLRSLHQFVSVAHKLGVHNYPVHIKLDTGMHRLGFMSNELDDLLLQIKTESSIRIASIFSHLAASDDAAFKDFTHHQASLFQQMSSKIIDAIGYKPLLHLCNTAGIVTYPEYHFDMVRLGLGMYGIDGSGGLSNQLQQISTLKTTIAQIKNISAGETIGYSRKGRVEKDMRVATICIGYADGYPRRLSNGEAYVMINNKPAKLIGSVAMDMCMVDITDIDAVQEGDEVIIFGDALPIQQLADWAKTIPYEIMTSISQRVKRVYINEA